jgi:ABC-type lipoprotein export system ATPase subunit
MEQPHIKKITILGGTDKKGNPEPVEKVEISAGERIGIVGQTGAGKSQLLYDIERLAKGETKSKRLVLINGEEAPEKLRHDPKNKVIGYITQNMKFLTDASVGEFLEMHIRARGIEGGDELIEKIVEDANKITGEAISREMNLLALSGGQSRALMAADVAYVSNSPIVLVDEIESAGINKEKALEILCSHEKIVFLVTHDPRLALNTDKRIVLKKGAISDLIHTSVQERGIAHYFSWIEKYLLEVRDDIRNGKRVEELKLICAPMQVKK